MERGEARGRGGKGVYAASDYLLTHSPPYSEFPFASADIRQMLDARALEVEAAARSVDRERRRLNAEFAAKVGELGDAKERLESQVARLETKELQLRKEWASCVFALPARARARGTAAPHLY